MLLFFTLMNGNVFSCSKDESISRPMTTSRDENCLRYQNACPTTLFSSRKQMIAMTSISRTYYNSANNHSVEYYRMRKNRNSFSNVQRKLRTISASSICVCADEIIDDLKQSTGKNLRNQSVLGSARKVFTAKTLFEILLKNTKLNAGDSTKRRVCSRCLRYRHPPLSSSLVQFFLRVFSLWCVFSGFVSSQLEKNIFPRAFSNTILVSLCDKSRTVVYFFTSAKVYFALIFVYFQHFLPYIIGNVIKIELFTNWFFIFSVDLFDWIPWKRQISNWNQTWRFDLKAVSTNVQLPSDDNI